ncbi:unnamed protein product [Mytilus coruscus]|uniref:Uncharacterized protein n=1 Tax=Mytilus coruscus TaxID=42192 RepID=A0A6J8CD21_MYTCO|nr:unnamed protein product [Mytilus coruscus]
MSVLDLKGSTVTQRPTITQRPAVTQRQVSIEIIAIVSSGCTAVFMIIVLLIKKLLCKYQCIGRGVNTNEAILANSELNEQPASIQEQSYVFRRNPIPESHYETIDESKMIDTSNIKTREDETTIRNSHTSKSCSDSNLSVASGVASEDTEGYLHPYNTLEENWQNKEYPYNSCIIKTKKRDKLQSFVIENNAIPDFQDQTTDESNINEISSIKKQERKN